MKDYTWLEQWRWFLGIAILFVTFSGHEPLENSALAFLSVMSSVFCIPITFEIIEKLIGEKISNVAKTLLVVVPLGLVLWANIKKYYDTPPPKVTDLNIMKAADNAKKDIQQLTGFFAVRDDSTGMPMYFYPRDGSYYPNPQLYYLDTAAVVVTEEILSCYSIEPIKGYELGGFVIRLYEEGTARLAEHTQNHVGHELAFVCNSQIITIPKIMGKVEGGSIEFTNPSYTEEDVETLAELINKQIKTGN